MTSWNHSVCRANGIDIHYQRTGGDKPSIVMLHGLIGSGACWAPVARMLERELDVVMPDARGHGASSAPQGGYRYEELASDVVGLMDSLGLHRPVLLGHSMGGMTAGVVASRAAGRLRALVLIDPTFLSIERQREVYASDVVEQHRRLLNLQKSELIAQARARSPHRSMELIALQAEARLKTSLRAFDVLTPPNPAYDDIVRAFDIPTLLIIGDSSPVVSLEMAEQLFRLNPRIRIEQVRGAGHGLPFDQPERLGALVASFVCDWI